jgi:hypothetical protein
MVCEILFSNLYLDLLEFEINYSYNYNNTNPSYYGMMLKYKIKRIVLNLWVS